MKILADMHISPVTISHLRSMGHDVIRVNEIADPKSPDVIIVELAEREKRVVLTQDLDFSGVVALSQKSLPSLITLRLASSRVDVVNHMLERILPLLEEDVLAGVAGTVTDHQIRKRFLPVT